MSPALSDVDGACDADAQLGADAGRELAQRERLRQVVDRAGVEAADAILDLPAGGEHDHRQRRLGVVDQLEHLEAAASRQHHVEHDEVDCVPERLVGAGGAVERGVDLEAMRAEPAFQEVDDSRLVLDDEDPVGHRPII